MVAIETKLQHSVHSERNYDPKVRSVGNSQELEFAV